MNIGLAHRLFVLQAKCSNFALSSTASTGPHLQMKHIVGIKEILPDGYQVQDLGRLHEGWSREEVGLAASSSALQ
jgi:hypothetical protein